MPKWMQWRMAGEQQMMASVALMSTTAANIALSWLTFIEQAEKGARGDVATKKVIELLSSERICNDIAGELEFLPESQRMVWLSVQLPGLSSPRQGLRWSSGYGTWRAPYTSAPRGTAEVFCRWKGCCTAGTVQSYQELNHG